MKLTTGRVIGSVGAGVFYQAELESGEVNILQAMSDGSWCVFSYDNQPIRGFGRGEFEAAVQWLLAKESKGVQK